MATRCLGVVTKGQPAPRQCRRTTNATPSYCPLHAPPAAAVPIHPAATAAAVTSAPASAPAVPVAPSLPDGPSAYAVLAQAVDRMRPSTARVPHRVLVDTAIVLVMEHGAIGRVVEGEPHLIDAMKFRYDPLYDDDSDEVLLADGECLSLSPTCEWLPLSQQDCVRIMDMLLCPLGFTLSGVAMADVLIACWRNNLPDERAAAADGTFHASSTLIDFIRHRGCDILNHRPTLLQLGTPPSQRGDVEGVLWGGELCSVRMPADTLRDFIRRILSGGAQQSAALWPVVRDMLNDPELLVRLDSSALDELSSGMPDSPEAATLRQWCAAVRDSVDHLLRAVQPPRVIVQAALNSSGDVYHLVAYLAWCQHMRQQPCRIVLCYDTEDTLEQANRAVLFAQQLGLGEFFLEPQPTSAAVSFNANGKKKNMCYQVASRQKRAEHLLPAEHSECVDHRLTTTILSDAALRFGRDTLCEVMRNAFTRTAARFPAVQQWASQEVARIKAALQALPAHRRALPTVLLHYRESSKANKEQALDAPALLQGPLSQKFNFIVVYAGRQALLEHAAAHSTPFLAPPLPPPQSGASQPDLGKLRHVYLLLELYRERASAALHLLGVVGNTSGTLDVAALVGHAVLDIHNFSSGGDQPERVFNYQAHRLLIQSPWIAVIDSKHPQLHERVLQWLKLDCDARRLGALPAPVQTEEAAAAATPANPEAQAEHVLCNDVPFGLSKAGPGAKGFFMLVAAYTRAVNADAAWQLLPQEAVDEAVHATHATLRRQAICTEQTIHELRSLTLQQ